MLQNIVKMTTFNVIYLQWVDMILRDCRLGCKSLWNQSQPAPPEIRYTYRVAKVAFVWWDQSPFQLSVRMSNGPWSVSDFLCIMYYVFCDIMSPDSRFQILGARFSHSFHSFGLFFIVCHIKKAPLKKALIRIKNRWLRLKIMDDNYRDRFRRRKYTRDLM